MDHKLKLVLNNNVSEITRMLDETDKWAIKIAIPKEVIRDVNVALDDLITNIISYAFQDKNKHNIYLEIWCEDKTIKAKIQDDGVAFNPLQLAPPDISSPLEKRKIGGLGIAIAKAMLDEISYKRESNNNILLLSKNWQ